jgi:hypothetical protein
MEKKFSSLSLFFISLLNKDKHEKNGQNSNELIGKHKC